MLTVIIDEGTSNELVFPADDVFERTMFGTFNAVKTYDLTKEKHIPAVPKINSPYFKTVKVITDNGVELPLTNPYNKILSVITHAEDNPSRFGISVDLGYEA